MLRRAVLALRRGTTDQAVDLAQQTLRIAPRAEEQTAAREVMGEAYFRAGCQVEDAATRLEFLDRAIRILPDQPRLRFQRAIALWQLDRLPEATAELDTVAAREPKRPGLVYLRHLARLGQTGQPAPPAVVADGLMPKEAGTIELIQRFWTDVDSGNPAIQADRPLLGDSAELWQALAALDGRPDAAPAEQLSRAARQAGGKAVRRVIGYYQGVAALRAGDRQAALGAWRAAREAGFRAPWAADNLSALVRETAIDLAAAGQWQAVADLVKQAPRPIGDRPLADTLALAFDHLGHAAVGRGNWQQAASHWERANTLAPTRHRAQNLALAAEALDDWDTAALAWREMVRRRPRKAGHPDYLDERQVAQIWAHAAECHAREGDYAAEIECLKTALKHAGDDPALRLKLVDALIADDRVEAGGNEIERILDRDPDNVEALIRRGTLEMDGFYDAVPTWQRAFRLMPGDARVRDGLALAHIKRLTTRWYYLSTSQEKNIKAALADLPDHPQLLLQIAMIRRDENKPDKAIDLFLRAHRAAPREPRTAEIVLHELLHLKAEAEVAELIAQVRQIPSLLPQYWVSQGERVLECKLDDAWAIRFFDEAVGLAEAQAEGRRTGGSKAAVLIGIFDTIFEVDPHSDLMTRYADRVSREVPESGAVEYIAAHRARFDADDRRQAERLLKAAARKAGQAGDTGVAEAVQTELDNLQGPSLEASMLRRLIELFPDGPPDLDDLKDLPDDFFEDFF